MPLPFINPPETAQAVTANKVPIPPVPPIDEAFKAHVPKLAEVIIAAVKNYGVQYKLTIPSNLIFAAMLYITNFYQKRLTAIGQDFFKLEKIIKDNNLEVK